MSGPAAAPGSGGSRLVPAGIGGGQTEGPYESLSEVAVPAPRATAIHRRAQPPLVSREYADQHFHVQPVSGCGGATGITAAARNEPGVGAVERELVGGVPASRTERLSLSALRERGIGLPDVLNTVLRRDHPLGWFVGSHSANVIEQELQRRSQPVLNVRLERDKRG